MPPRLAITVGMAVATTVDSMAARKMAAMTPASTSPRRARARGGHQCPPVQPAQRHSARRVAYG